MCARVCMCSLQASSAVDAAAASQKEVQSALDSATATLASLKKEKEKMRVDLGMLAHLCILPACVSPLLTRASALLCTEKLQVSQEALEQQFAAASQRIAALEEERNQCQTIIEDLQNKLTSSQADVDAGKEELIRCVFDISYVGQLYRLVRFHLLDPIIVKSDPSRLQLEVAKIPELEEDLAAANTECQAQAALIQELNDKVDADDAELKRCNSTNERLQSDLDTAKVG
ncbi:MAG: hypothetical protein P4L40_08775 [Terracidiphilus sp.]|nr:hypothetical protein [Terracidiphilus sp.]